MKATHKGHCQVCDHVQMLPGGRLAKHGYTKRWGFFSGTCFGSGNLPFEQDKTLIDHAIDRAISRRHAIQHEINVLKETISTKAWMYLYFLSKGKIAGYYRWQQVELQEVRDQWGVDIRYMDPADKEEVSLRTIAGLPFEAKSDAKVAAGHFNGKYVINLEKQLENIGDYIKWQQSRIANWIEKPLIPRE